MSFEDGPMSSSSRYIPAIPARHLAEAVTYIPKPGGKKKPAGPSGCMLSHAERRALHDLVDRAFRAPATRWPEPAPEFGVCLGCGKDDYLVTGGLVCFHCSELAAERRRLPQPPPAEQIPASQSHARRDTTILGSGGTVLAAAGAVMLTVTGSAFWAWWLISLLIVLVTGIAVLAVRGRRRDK